MPLQVPRHPAPPSRPHPGRAPELLVELAELGMAAARAFQAQDEAGKFGLTLPDLP